MRSAVVLAGGRSTRFGDADKALEPLAGRSMTRRVADRLSGVTDEVVVNCRADQEGAVREQLSGLAVSFRVAVDPVPDRGPVAGMRSGLAAASGEYAAVVACDMPFVDPDFVAYLFDRAAGTDGAVPRPDEYYEVTQAVYHVASMVEACDSALESGDPKVLEPLSYLDVEIVDGPEVATHADPRTFENVNTREEFEAVGAVLGSDVDDGVGRDEAGEDDAIDAS